MKEFEILITDPPDRKDLVAELWYDNHLIAEINQEEDVVAIEIYSQKKMCSIPIDQFEQAIELAKNKLIG